MKGWKVVIDLNGRFFSATWGFPRPHDETHAIAGYHGVEYIPGQPTHPRPGYGPLGVFSDPTIANKFADARRCVTPSVTILPCTYRPAMAQGFWYPGRNKVENVPAGTEFADEVILEKP